MPVTRVHPVDVLASSAEPSPPRDRLGTMGRLAASPGLGVRHHAEPPARDEGERLRVVGRHLEVPRSEGTTRFAEVACFHCGGLASTRTQPHDLRSACA